MTHPPRPSCGFRNKVFVTPALKYFLKPELNIQVGCNQVVKIGKGEVVERGDVEEVVEILNIHS